MATLVFPDGTRRDVPDSEVAGAVNSGAMFEQDAVAVAQQQAPEQVIPEGEEGSQRATAFMGGLFRGAVPAAGDTLLDNFLELQSQLTDDYSYQNRVNEARRAYGGTEMAGRILGNVGTAIAMPTTAPAALARYGETTASILTNAGESAIMLAGDQAAEAYTEALLERPDISGEDLAAAALRGAFTGAASGAVLGGLGTAAFYGARGAARYARQGAEYVEGALRGTADDVTVAAASGLNSATPDQIASMASRIDLDPSSPLAQAVRRAEAEGLESFTTRTAREVSDELTPSLSHVPRTPDVPMTLIQRVLPDGQLEAQRVATNVILSSSDVSHRALSEVASNAADNEALTLLNIARQRAATESMAAGNIASEVQRHTTAVQRLTELSEAMTPAARSAVEPYLARANEILGNKQIFGEIADSAAAIQGANSTLRMAREAADAGTLSANIVAEARKAAEFLVETYKDSTSRGLQRQVERYRTILSGLSNAESTFATSAKVVELSNVLAERAVAGGYGTAAKMVAGAVGYKVAGPFGASIANQALRISSEVGYKRTVLWKAQNAYARFRGRTAESLLRFVQNPKPRPAYYQPTQQAYEAAVDAIKRARDMPTSYNTPDPHSKAIFEPTWVEPRTVPISASPETVDMLRREEAVYREAVGMRRTMAPGDTPIVTPRRAEVVSPRPQPRASAAEAVDEGANTIPPPTRAKRPVTQAPEPATIRPGARR